MTETQKILLEVIGYIGLIVCTASFIMTSVRKLRIINGIGAVISAFYSIMIGALPIALMNVIIAILDAYQLWRMRQVHEVFELVPAMSDGAYFKWFVDRYKSELIAFDKTLSFGDAQHVLYYVRDNEVAGILAYDDKEEGIALIRIDFVIPKYRDFRIGNFFFGPDNPFFKEASITQFVTKTSNPIHEAYLKRIGFSKTSEDEWSKTFK